MARRATPAWDALREKKNSRCARPCFLDIGMPGMTGIEAARKIARARAGRGTAPGLDRISAPRTMIRDQAFEPSGVVRHLLKRSTGDRLQSVERLALRLQARGTPSGEGAEIAPQESRRYWSDLQGARLASRRRDT